LKIKTQESHVKEVKAIVAKKKEVIEEVTVHVEESGKRRRKRN
jgi:DNA mismatch repair protein MutS2